MSDPLYVPMLANKTYHNLDENGICVEKDAIIDNGVHSINSISIKVLKERKQFARQWEIVTLGKDFIFAEKIDSVNNGVGLVRWYQGQLKSIRNSSREFLYYHRGERKFRFPSYIKRAELIEDMLAYGYLLPYFTPLMTRFYCLHKPLEFWSSTTQEFHAYQPYSLDCYNEQQKQQQKQQQQGQGPRQGQLTTNSSTSTTNSAQNATTS
jgi:hypothetical protein